MNIATNLEKAAFHFPEHIAIFDRDRKITFHAFNRESSRIAAALADAEIQPGHHVALCAPNSYAWLAFYFGVIKAGAVAVTFSYLLTKPELVHTISDCQPKAIFTTGEILDKLKDPKNTFCPLPILCDDGDNSFQRFVEKGASNFKTVDRDRHDTCAILYTGGTTGTPKGAMLSHENLQTSIFNVAHSERSTEKDRALCFLPLNHVFAQIHIMNSVVYSAGGLVIQSGFDLDAVVNAIQRFQVTKFYAVPTVYIRLLELKDLKHKLDSVRYCFSAAASMATEVVREWKKHTGLDIHEAYGMTESSSMVTYNHYYRHVVGSVGTPANLVEVQIRDLDGNLLKQGDQGEICIRGPNITKGYLNNPEETRNAFRGDWFRSGDIGLIDDDGYLYIVDRLKDLIITGGENVYPREIEELLYTRPEVQECAVIGLPDREYGERVMAIIVPYKNQKIDTAAIKSYLREQLAGFKVPKGFICLDELPKNNAGKILKREIRLMYQGLAAEDKQP